VALPRWHLSFCVMPDILRQGAPYVDDFIKLTLLVATNVSLLLAGVDELSLACLCFRGHKVILAFSVGNEPNKWCSVSGQCASGFDPNSIARKSQTAVEKMRSRRIRSFHRAFIATQNWINRSHLLLTERSPVYPCLGNRASKRAKRRAKRDEQTNGFGPGDSGPPDLEDTGA